MDRGWPSETYSGINSRMSSEIYYGIEGYPVRPKVGQRKTVSGTVGRPVRKTAGQTEGQTEGC